MDMTAEKAFAEIRATLESMGRQRTEMRYALELLLHKASCTHGGNAGSDFQAWHRATAADIGEILTAARRALETS